MSGTSLRMYRGHCDSDVACGGEKRRRLARILDEQELRTTPRRPAFELSQPLRQRRFGNSHGKVNVGDRTTAVGAVDIGGLDEGDRTDFDIESVRAFQKLDHGLVRGMHEGAEGGADTRPVTPRTCRRLREGYRKWLHICSSASGSLQANPDRRNAE